MNELDKLLVMKENGATIDILTKIIQIYIAQNQLDLAQKTLEEIDCLGAKNYYYYYKAVMLEIAEKYNRAIDYYELAYKEDNNLLIAIYDKARMLDKIGSVKKAIAAYKFLLNSDIDNIISVYVNLSSIYELSHFYQKAIDILEIAIKKALINQDILYNLGVAYMRIANYEKAIYFYLEATNYISCNKYTYFNLGVCYKCLKEYKEALRFYQMAETKGVPKPMVFYNMACVYTILHDDEKALALLDKCFIIDKSYVDFALNDSELISVLEIKNFIQNY